MITLDYILEAPDVPMSDNWVRHFDRCATHLIEEEQMSEMREHVYFIESQGMVKIGKAQHLTRRLHGYFTHNPSFQVLGILPDWDESEVHRDLHHLRKHGEWFTDCPELRGYMNDLMPLTLNEFKANSRSFT